MQILNDKNVRLQTIITVLMLVALIIAGQFTVIRMADDYKNTMIAHDDAIAGYLLRNGIDNHQIVLAVTSEKVDSDVETGSALLTASGYKY